MSKMVADKSSDVLVVEAIGRTRFRTPEGYLYCEGVRISSTKPMLYRADEMPELDPQDGMVLMQREPDVLFAPETLASFHGKDITFDHPEELLSPADWKESSVGTVLSPRRGEGVEFEYLIADLIIKHEEAIEAVEKGMREVSCGYDGERESIKPGLGRFTRIIGNHVALVERGRCGPACAIGDEDTTMANKPKRSVIDRLRTAFKAKDEAAFEEELGNAAIEMEPDLDEPQKVIIEVRNPAAVEAGESAVEQAVTEPVEDEPDDPMAEIKAAIAAIAARLDKLEAPAVTSDEDPEKKDDEDDKEKKEDETKNCKAMDAATVSLVKSEFQAVVAKAEILSPGVKLPTFDAKASRKTIADSMCALRKAALVRAVADEKRKGFVTAIAGDKPAFSKMSCDHMAVVFNAASELARASNNGSRVSVDHANFPQGKMTPEKYQVMIAERRKKLA